MSETGDTAADESLQQRVLQLEQEADERAISDAYGRFYAPLAAMALFVSTMPLYESMQVTEGVTRTFDSTWAMAGNPNGGPAVLGLIFLISLLTAACFAAVRTKSAALPVSIAVLASIIVLMIVLKPGTGTPKPDLTDVAIAGVVFSLAMVGLSVAHAVHLLTRARRNPAVARTGGAPGDAGAEAEQ